MPYGQFHSHSRWMRICVGLAILFSTVFTAALPTATTIATAKELSVTNTGAGLEILSQMAGSLPYKKGVELRWSVSTIDSKAGFNIYRADQLNQTNYTKINQVPISNSTINTPDGNVEFSFIDISGRLGQWYRIEDLDILKHSHNHVPFQAFSQSLPPVQNTNDHSSITAIQPSLVKPHPVSFSTLKFFISSDGVYRITYSALQSAGLNLSGYSGSQVHITSWGKSIEVSTNTSGSLDASSYFDFYGQANQSQFSSQTAYYINFDGQGPPVYTLSQPKHLRPGPQPVIINGSSNDKAGPNYQIAGPIKPRNPALPSSYRAVSHFEQDIYYIHTVNGDHPFAWDYVNSEYSPSSCSFTFTLTALPNVAGTNTVTITGLLIGGGTEQDSTHLGQLSVNGTVVTAQPLTWKGLDNQTFAVSFPQSLLISGDNILTLQTLTPATAASDSILLSYFDVSYWRNALATNNQFSATLNPATPTVITGFQDSQISAYDVTDPSQPHRITVTPVAAGDGTYWLTLGNSSGGLPGRSRNRSYFLTGSGAINLVTNLQPNGPANLKANTNAADLIIISHSMFLSQAQDLANLHINSLGQRTSVVNLDDIYDTFSYGNVDPQAIKDFLAYALGNWQSPAPKWVLLIGGGTFNYKAYAGMSYSGVNLIPAHYTLSTIYHTRAEGDDWYVAGPDGLTPTMAIGRLPAQTVTEAANAVTNIKNYVTAAPTGSWRRQANFVADARDGEGNLLTNPIFANDSSTIINGSIPPAAAMNVTTYYAGNRKDGVTAINNPAAVVNYMGHGAYSIWSVINLLHSDDAQPLASGGQLNNGGKRPFVAELTCFTGEFDLVTNALGWQLVDDPDGGAIATLAASSWTDEGPDLLAGQILYPKLFSAANPTFGEVTQAVVTGLVQAGPFYYDTANTYNLIGDPAISLAR